MYKSLTADRIMIHPGSVMFKEDPRYIVAGEIVRTTRMYAMSVSPITVEIMERISPILVSELAGKSSKSGITSQRGASGKGERGRDFTNNIRIGNEIFPIEIIKGKKHVNLPWERLVPLKENYNKGEAGTAMEMDQYRGMRGTITLNGRYTLLAGEKLSLILTLLPGLELSLALEQNWPRKENFDTNTPENIMALLDNLDVVLRPAVWKRKSTGGGKELGFIALFTDGEGSYWFRCSRGFHTSLNESIASLEALIDELGDDVDIELKHKVNQAYRRLSDYLGEE
jgi:hypothetical protein